MASVDELKSVLKATLENRGVLSQLRARIRSEVFNALDEQNDLKPVLSNENLLINELIREYMEFNKYKYSCSVLTAEANQPKEHIDKRFLKQELNIEESLGSDNIPLLYGIISYFVQGKNIKHQKRNETNIQAEEEPITEDETRTKLKNDLIIYSNH